MRELAAWALYQIEDPASIPRSTRLFQRDQNKDSRSRTSRLSRGGEKSVDALKSLLESNDPEKQVHCGEGVGGEDRGRTVPCHGLKPVPFRTRTGEGAENGALFWMLVA